MAMMKKRVTEKTPVNKNMNPMQRQSKPLNLAIPEEWESVLPDMENNFIDDAENVNLDFFSYKTLFSFVLTLFLHMSFPLKWL